MFRLRPPRKSGTHSGGFSIDLWILWLGANRPGSHSAVRAQCNALVARHSRSIRCSHSIRRSTSFSRPTSQAVSSVVESRVESSVPGSRSAIIGAIIGATVRTATREWRRTKTDWCGKNADRK